MDRGAGFSTLPSSLRIHTSLPFWPLLSRSRHPLRREPRRPSGGVTPARGSKKLLLSEQFRSYIHSKEKGCQIMKKALRKSHSSLAVFSSYRSQEANLSGEDARNNKFLIDCETDQECVVGGIVALGKFDALHIGHRELAVQASKAGVPFLLSFVGMVEVFGWELRLPIVAKCDRKRVFSSWAPYCGNVIPIEFQIQFSNVRHLTPRQFVERISKELRVSGVVAGENYRFGYKASGDAVELVRLCREYDLSAYIVKPVMDNTKRSHNGTYRDINSNDRGQVSSSRVRHALALGDMQYVEELLGRKHRLMVKLEKGCCCTKSKISVTKSCILNQPPGDGVFRDCTLLVDEASVAQCSIVITAETIDIEFHDASIETQDLTREDQLIGLEFG